MKEASENPRAFIRKATVSPARTDIAGWAAEFVVSGSTGLFDTIAPESVYAD